VSAVRAIISHRIVITLIVFAVIVLAVLGFLNAIIPGNPILNDFDMDSEDSVTTWFSTLLIAFNALLLLTAGLVSAGGGRSLRRHWFGLAAIFAVLSLDEMASLHERIGNSMKEAYDLTGYLSFSWVIPGSIFVLIVALAYAPFLLRIPRGTAALMVLAGAVFVAGSIGIEIIEAGHSSVFGRDAGYRYLVVVEETLELAGQALFAWALLRHLGNLRAIITFGHREALRS
jgi:magnesium-transporting ATPase (P-type)